MRPLPFVVLGVLGALATACEQPLGRGHFTYQIGLSGEYPSIEAVRD